MAQPHDAHLEPSTVVEGWKLFPMHYWQTTDNRFTFRKEQDGRWAVGARFVQDVQHLDTLGLRERGGVNGSLHELLNCIVDACGCSGQLCYYEPCYWLLGTGIVVRNRGLDRRWRLEYPQMCHPLNKDHAHAVECLLYQASFSSRRAALKKLTQTLKTLQ